MRGDEKQKKKRKEKKSKKEKSRIKKQKAKQKKNRTCQSRIGAVVGAKLTPPSRDRQIFPLLLTARNRLLPSPLTAAPRQLSSGSSTEPTCTGAPLETPEAPPRLVTVTTAVSGPELVGGEVPVAS